MNSQNIRLRHARPRTIPPQHQSDVFWDSAADSLASTDSAGRKTLMPKSLIMTQAEYDALTPDDNTLYYIVG